MPYTVKLVSQPLMEEPRDQYPPRGGFGLSEDDIIYQTVHRELDERKRYSYSDEDEDQDYEQ